MGSGKTMLAVDHARRLAKARGAVLVSNIKIEVPDGVLGVVLSTGRDGFDADQLEAVIEWARARGKGVVVLLDELGLLMPARKWQAFPVRLIRTVTQSRKFHVDLVATAQYEALVDGTFRLNAQEAYLVRCYPAPTLLRFERGMRPWFFRLTQYVPGHVGEKAHQLERKFIRYRKYRETWYDTDQTVGVPERLQDNDEKRAADWVAWADETLELPGGSAHDAPATAKAGASAAAHGMEG